MQILKRQRFMPVPGLHGLNLIALLKESGKRFLQHDMRTHAAALSFYIIFSIFPVALFLISLFSFLDLSYLLEWARDLAEGFLLNDTMRQVDEVLAQLERRRRGLLSMSIIGVLWAASYPFRATVNALNVVYGVKEDRPFWKVCAMSTLYTLAIGILLVSAALLFLIGPRAIQWVLQPVGMKESWISLWAFWLRWPVLVLLLALILALVYGLAPDVDQRFRFVTPGAVLAVLTWIAASFGFQFYVHAFVNFKAMYGSVGTMIVFLLYFYISSGVLLFGAEVNAVIEQHAPSGKNRGEKNLHRN
jgi:membrane protein